jgi:hypothetical protein
MTAWAYFLNGANPETDRLARLALEDFRDRSGLSPETLEQAQVRLFSGNADLLKEGLGFASSDGQKILNTARLVELPSFTVDGNVTAHHYRLYPAVNDCRYLHPKGEPARPYLLPDVWAVKDKAHKPIAITEGGKKALRLLQHGQPTIALLGVWNFRNEDEPFLFHELEAFTWSGRTVYLAFDSDLWTNPQVRVALFELALKRMSKGAVVRFLKWTGAKGIDDYLVTQKNPEKALEELQYAAVP